MERRNSTHIYIVLSIIILVKTKKCCWSRQYMQSSLGGGTGNETNSRREKFQYLLHYTVCMAKSEGDLQEVWKVPLGSNEVKLSEVAIASRTLELSLH